MKLLKFLKFKISNNLARIGTDFTNRPQAFIFCTENCNQKAQKAQKATVVDCEK